MTEFSEKDIERFLKWKAKRAHPEEAIEQQTQMRLFKEKYGVDRASNFHCPWCFSGRLYLREVDPEELPIYVCKGCELQFQMVCLNQEELDAMAERRKEERRQRREAKKAEGPSDEELQQMLDAWKEAHNA